MPQEIVSMVPRKAIHQVRIMSVRVETDMPLTVVDSIMIDLGTRWCDGTVREIHELPRPCFVTKSSFEVTVDVDEDKKTYAPV